MINGNIIYDGKVHNNLQAQVAKNTEDIANLADKFVAQESTDNKVITISSTSTDTLYPSAKASYTYGQSIKTTIEAQIPHYTSQLTNDSGYLTSHLSLAAYRTAADLDIIDSQWQTKIADLDTIRSGAAAGATAVQPSAITDMATKTWVGQQGYLTEHQSLAAYRTSAAQDIIDATKQDVISDLSTIRQGALLGHTAVQPGVLSSYMTLDTDQTATSKKTLSYTEPIVLGGQETILNVLSTHYSDDMNAMWAGRVKIGNRDKTFLLGVYRQAQLGQSAICGIGAHSWNDSFEESGAAWEDIYLNPDGNKAVYIGNKDWRNDTGWFKVQNDGGESAKYRTFINSSTIQNPIWRPVLGNLTSGSYSLFLSPTVGNTASAAYCTSLGSGAIPSSTYITNIGYNTTSSGQYGTALGYNAHANAQNAIQIGTGTNSSQKTLSIGLDSTHNYQLLNSSGLIPNERINSSALLQSIAGYDASKTQVLKHINGVFTWVDE